MDENRSTEENIIVTMFRWWNNAMQGQTELTAESFGRFYTEDCQLVVNGNLRAKGLQSLAAHYRKIQLKCDRVEMILPVEESFNTSTRAFVHCRTRAVINASESAEEAMAYAKSDHGRMTLLRVVSLSVG